MGTGLQNGQCPRDAKNNLTFVNYLCVNISNNLLYLFV